VTSGLVGLSGAHDQQLPTFSFRAVNEPVACVARAMLHSGVVALPATVTLALRGGLTITDKRDYEAAADCCIAC
jgi:hypothetical protein